MKKTLLIATILLVTFATAGLTVDQVLDSMDANSESQTARMEITQTVYRVNGQKDVSELLSYSADKGDKGLMVYVQPARIKGMKILTLHDGDDIWSYSPRTKRVRKIASHQKKQSVNGSDFSYEDMNTNDRREEYISTLLAEEMKEGVATYKIEMIPKESTITSYSKMIMWIQKGKWLPIYTEFYDEYQDLWKVLTLKNITKVGAYWNAGEIVMINKQKGTKTVMTNKKTEFDIELDMGMFTERYLNR